MVGFPASAVWCRRLLRFSEGVTVSPRRCGERDGEIEKKKMRERKNQQQGWREVRAYGLKKGMTAAGGFCGCVINM
jgi:hypothetical protein